MPFLSPQPWLRVPSQAKQSKAVGIQLGRASPAPRLLPKVPRKLEGTGQAGTMQQRALSSTCASTQPAILQVGDWQGQEKGREGRERVSALLAALLGQEPLPSPRVPAHGAVPVHTDTHTHVQQTCKHTHMCMWTLQACTHMYTHNTHVVINCAQTHAQTSAHGLSLPFCTHTAPARACPHTHTCTPTQGA